MKILNKLNYPQAVVEAAKAQIHEPDPEIIRVTQLISPPIQRTLLIKHWDEIETDVDDCFAALLGTAWHEKLAAFGPQNKLVERRWERKVDGVRISGAMDIAGNGAIEDYKLTSGWTLVYGGRDEWEEQLNVYSWLIRTAGYPADVLIVHLFFKDWTAYLAKTNENYPEARYVKLRFDAWPIEEQDEFVRNKIHIHKTQANESCSFDDRWQTKEMFNLEGEKVKAYGNTYAVMKGNNKRATRVLPTKAECEQYVAQAGMRNATIEERPCEPKRCLNYCSVRPFCPFGKTLKIGAYNV